MGQNQYKRLLRVGEAVCNGIHGANRLASNSFEGLVFGRRIGLLIKENLNQIKCGRV